MTARTSPRVYRDVALPTPSDHEKTQVYAQRYIAHFPAAGEIILFDRSWYNRAGVERVMGFCTEEESERFLLVTPAVEREVVVPHNRNHAVGLVGCGFEGQVHTRQGRSCNYVNLARSDFWHDQSTEGTPA